MKIPQSRRGQQSGVSLFIATVSLMFIVPMLGLVVDTGFLYGAKTQLQGSVDGAALAAGRALRLGQTTTAQANNAKTNAVNWFYANFPDGTWSTTSTTMNLSNVAVYDDALNPNLRHVDVTASAVVPTYFMRWLGKTSTTINAMGFATRRDVIGMLVLDRSGSMGSACGNLKTAAKIFTGQFAAGRDRLGLVSFSDGFYKHSAPVTTFQTVLGYTGSGGSASGAIDGLSCGGGTGTAAAVSIAYNELYKLKLPGALNLILLETDGLPTAASYNFWDGADYAITATSNCTDANGRKKSSATPGWVAPSTLPIWPAVPANAKFWGPGVTMSGVDSTGTATQGYMSNIPPAPYGTLYADQVGTNSWSLGNPAQDSTGTTLYLSGTSANPSSGTPGCTFAGGRTVNESGGGTAWSDFAWIPQSDMWGNAIEKTPNEYKSITTGTNGRYIMAGSYATNRAVLDDIEANLTDNSAYRARTSKAFCGGGTCQATASELKAYVYTVGFTNSVDHALLQRMANASQGDQINLPAKFSPCAQTSNCVTYDDQPKGLYVFAPDTTKLNEAFMAISSQVLRLSN